MFPKRAVWLLIGLHFFFAGLYAYIAPYRTPGIIDGLYMADIGAPDELAHSKYIQYVSEGKGLPSPIASKDMATYEAHQPPLYYAASAIWTKIGFCTDFSSGWCGYWQRLMNVLIGCLTVLGASRMAWLATKKPNITLVTGTIVALLPMNVGVSASINNDPLLICFGTWIIALLVQAYQEDWSVKNGAIVGLMLGLSLLTKTSAIAFFLPLAFCLLLSNPGPKPIIWLRIPLLAIILASPIWIRNYILYNDPLLLKTFAVNSAGDSMPDIWHNTKAFAHYFLVFVQQSTESFFGLLGYMYIRFPVWIYVLLIFATGLLVLGAAKNRKSQQSQNNKGVNWIIGSLLIGALILYLRFNIEHTEPQARYFFTAIAPIGYFLAIGFDYWFLKKMRVSYPLLVALLVVLNCSMAAIMVRAFRTMQDDLREAGGTAVFEKKNQPARTNMNQLKSL